MYNVGFVKGTKFILPVGDTSSIFCLQDVKCVRVALSNGGHFICGEDQLILLDGGEWCSAIDCYNKSIGGHRVDGIELCGKHDTYDLEVFDEEHIFSILVNDCVIKVHNAPVISDLASPNTTNTRVPKYFKYIPYDVTKNRTVIRTHHIKKKNRPIDIANLVLLGGTFEKVGEEDEVIGGGSQKMGSVIQ